MFGTTRSNIFKVIFGFVEYFKLLPTRGDSSVFIYTYNIMVAIIAMILDVLHLIQTIRYKSNGWVHVVFEDLSQLLPLQTFIYVHLIFVYNKRAIYELVRKTEDLGAFGNDKQLTMTDKRLAGIIKIMLIVMSGLMPTCGIAKFILQNCEVRSPCGALANFWIPVSNENAFVVFVYPLIQLLTATYITMSFYCMDFTIELSKQLLIMRLEHLNRILSKVQFNRTEKCNLKLKMCIVYHDRILSLHKEHTKCFSLMTIVPYFSYSIVTSLSLVMISINGSVVSILTITTWTTLIFLASYFAQKLLDVGAKLCETAYDINWYEGSVPSQKDLLLFLLKLQVPLKTGMSGIGEMSFENMGRILGRCYSFFLIFLKMK